MPADLTQNGVADIVRADCVGVGQPRPGGCQVILVAQPGIERMGKAAQVAQQLGTQRRVGDHHTLAHE
ncbi:hypothetical protein D3C81_1768970 [compost metagenome]